MVTTFHLLLELHSLWIIAVYPRTCICCCLSDQEQNKQKWSERKAHTHSLAERHTTMHFTCQPEAAFWPIFLWQTVLIHLCKQQSRRLEKILFSFFLVYLLLKSDTNLCHTPCVIFFACLPLWFHFVFFFSLSFVQIIDNVTFSFSPAFFLLLWKKF